MSLPYLMNLLGSPTKIQIQVLCFLLILALVSISILLSIPLYFQQPILICNSTKEGEYISDSTNNPCNCKYYTIDYENSPKSMTTEFLWICDRDYLKDLLGTIVFFSQSIGYLFFTLYKGINKVTAIYMTSLINGILMIITYFITEYFLLALIIGFYFFFANALIPLTPLLLTDISGENQTFRGWSISIVLSSWGLASMFAGFLGYIYFNWRIYFTCYVGLPLVLACIYFKDINNPNKFPQLHINDILQKKQVNPFRILRFPSLRITIIAGSLLSAIINIDYFGVYYILGSLMGNIYLNLILLGAVELVSCLALGYILSIFKRRSIMAMCYLITGIAYMMFIFFNNDDDTTQQTWIIVLNVSLALIGKSVIDINFPTHAVFFSEVLPKSVRQEGYGFINGIFKIFVVFIPRFVTFMKSRDINPFVGFAVINLLALIAIYYMPETFNKKIEDYTIEEMKELEEDKYVMLDDCKNHA